MKNILKKIRTEYLIQKMYYLFMNTMVDFENIRKIGEGPKFALFIIAIIP